MRIRSGQNDAGGRRGSALVAVFTTIFILSLFALLAGRLLLRDLEWVGLREARLEALAWAETGLSLAGHPNMERTDPSLSWRSPETGGGYSVTITSEDARLNPNHIILRGDDQLLRDLFVFWGMDPDQASAYVDCLGDWIDEDDLERLNGAEAEAYARLGLPGLPPNRPLRSVSEMSQVLGGEWLEVINPRWADSFSVRAGGLLDLRDASADLIAVALAIPMDRALRFVELRNGPDGIPFTEDDPPMETLEDALLMIGAIGIPDELLAERVTVNSDNLRITSTGYSGSVRRTIAALVAGSGAGRSIFWRAEVPSD